MSATITRDAEGTVTGNTYDKYGSTNPVVRRLMATFERDLGELFESVDPASVLDVGCGEAILTHKWAMARPHTRVVGFDLEDPAIQAEWEQRTRAQPRVPDPARAGALPLRDGEFALATAIEVLEHVPDPEHTVAEMARCARGGHLLVSVPREPLWRARERGPRRLPARPRQHAGAREPLVQARVRRAAVPARRGRRDPLAVPVDDAARACLSYGRGATGSSRRGSPRPGSSPSPTSPSPRTSSPTTQYASISLLWSVLFVTVTVLYRPIEQLLSRTIADRRARGVEHDLPLRTPLLLQGGFALAFLLVALAAARPIRDELLGGSSALYAILVVAVLAYAASYFARGWLAGHQWFALYGGARLPGGDARACSSPLAVAVGIAEGQTAVALGMAAAPLVSLVVVPLAFRRRPPAPAVGDGARGQRPRPRPRRPLRARRARDHGGRADAAQRRGADHGDHGDRRRGRRASSSTSC